MNNIRNIATILALGALPFTAHAATINVTVNTGTAATGSLDVAETQTSSGGVYDVANNTNGFLWGFGVSNNDTAATMFSSSGNATGFSCRGSNGCYEANTITSSGWGDVAYTHFFVDNTGTTITDYTFQQLFGDFATASGGDNTFHWYVNGDGGLNAGAAQDDFFGFLGQQLASSIIGITETDDGNFSAFTAGQATVPDIAAVPLPAAGMMLVAGVGALGAMKRRKKA